MKLPKDRSNILSEQRHPDTRGLDRLGTDEALELFDAVDEEVLHALRSCREELGAFIDEASKGFLEGGRVFYLGAGTSGRLGVLDASECPPTFNVESGRVVGLIAGGDRSLRTSSEGKEDDPKGAIEILQEHGLNARDAVVGIAAGGTTPFVRGALEWCASLSEAPLTCLLTCAPVPAPKGCRHLICAPTGPELLTGSTRMKAGTATKLILNRISTLLMVKEGRVLENLMVGMRASNEKLVDRAIRVMGEVLGTDRQEALELLMRCDRDLKVALVVGRTDMEPGEARDRLDEVGGRLSKVEGFLDEGTT